VNVLGAVAVSAMVLAYALEARHRAFVGVFAVACAASSVYGFLIGSLPFGVVEAVWSVVAVRRLRRAPSAGHPFASLDPSVTVPGRRRR
jgi:hypothetical protein